MKLHLFQKSLVVFSALMVAGCAEGPLWRMGKFSPWATQKWEQEEQLADTLFERKNQMAQIVDSARDKDLATKNLAAEKLAKTAVSDPILLVRLQAVRKLSELPCPASFDALTQAGMDPEAQVRLATVESWRKMPTEVAVPSLQKILGSDMDVDVRLAATRALGDFSGTPTIAALRMALTDPDPAIRLRATKSMARASGESFGADVRAWREYADHMTGTSPQTAAVNSSNSLK